MAIKPIDLQTHIAQITEVGRGEQARMEAVVEQQHLREKEANEQSMLINSRLDEAKKGERTAIKDEEKGGEGQQSTGQEAEEQKEKKAKIYKKKEKVEDDRMGKIIDILK